MVEASEADEEVVRVFDCYLGRWAFTNGLLFITDRRLVYLTYGWLRRRKLTSIPFDSIKQAKANPFAGGLELVIETASGELLTFSRGLGGNTYFKPIFDAMAKMLGDRFVSAADVELHT